MSWGINYIGAPDKIVDALNKQSQQLTGKSKEEFDAALPHMIGLIEQNRNSSYTPVLQLNGSGHGSDSYNYCTVKIESLNGALV